MTVHRQGYEAAVSSLLTFEKTANRLDFAVHVLGKNKNRAAQAAQNVAKSVRSKPKSVLRTRKLRRGPTPAQKPQPAPKAAPEAAAAKAAPEAAEKTKKSLGRKLIAPGLLAGGTGLAAGGAYLGAKANEQPQPQNMYPRPYYQY